MNPILKALAEADAIVEAQNTLEASTRHAKCTLRWSNGARDNEQGFATRKSALACIARDAEWAAGGGGWLEYLAIGGRHHVAFHTCEYVVDRCSAVDVKPGDALLRWNGRQNIVVAVTETWKRAEESSPHYVVPTTGGDIVLGGLHNRGLQRASG